jgi:hypothetical protein
VAEIARYDDRRTKDVFLFIIIFLFLKSALGVSRVREPLSRRV